MDPSHFGNHCRGPDLCLHLLYLLSVLLPVQLLQEHLRLPLLLLQKRGLLEGKHRMMKKKMEKISRDVTTRVPPNITKVPLFARIVDISHTVLQKKKNTQFYDVPKIAFPEHTPPARSFFSPLSFRLLLSSLFAASSRRRSDYCNCSTTHNKVALKGT